MRLLELSPVQYRKVRTLAKYSNTVEYQLRTTLDSSGIAKLKAELMSLQNSLVNKNAQGLIPDSAFKKTMADIKQVETALTRAFNGKLGMLDLKKFNSELTAGGKTLSGYYQSFSNLGSQGTRAFGQMYGQLTKVDTGMKQVSSTTDKIMNTFGNTFRWGMIASVFSGIMNSIHKSVQYVKDLDKSLTNIQMVTAQSRESMNNFAVKANEAAKQLGGTTVQMTNATEVFIRQGHSLETATELGQYSVHLANVSGQDSATASDEITAYMNAFHIPLEELGNAISKWAAVANNAAVSVEELSVASQKAASVATTVGVDMDQFAGHIAAIEATTREAPENIGNGLKTLYSRIADVKLGETLEDGVDLGSFAKAIEKVGVEVLNDAGELRDAGDIIEDLMVVWQDLDKSQQAAVAKTVAGRFQLARFEALMNSADIYEKSLKVSQAEQGTDTYDRMQETYKESMEGRLNTLSATIEGIFTKAFNTDDFYSLIDAATALAETFDNLVQAIGGGNSALTALGAVLTRVFSKNIAQGIGNSVLNRQTNQLAQNNMMTAVQNAKMTAAVGGIGTSSAYMNNMSMNVANVQKNMGTASPEQLEKINAAAQKHINIMTEAAVAEKEFASALEVAEIAIKSQGVTVQATGSLSEKYTAILKRLAEAEADGVGYEAAQSEMYKAIEADVKKLSLSLNEYANSLEKALTGEKLSEKQLQNLSRNAKNLNLVIKELAESETLSAERKEQLASVSKVLSAITRGEVKDWKACSQAMQNAGIDAAKFAEALQTAGQDGYRLQEVLQQLVMKHNQLSSAAAVSTKEMQGMSAALAAQNFAHGVANFASGAMNVIFAFQSIRGAIAAMNNEDLDPFEKMEQSLMGFAMAGAMVGPMIANLIKAMRQNYAVTIAGSIATDAAAMSRKKATDVMIQEGIMAKFAGKSMQSLTKDELQEVIASHMQATGKKKFSRELVAAIAAQTGMSAANVREAITAAGGTIATKGFTAAIREFVVAMGLANPTMWAFIGAAAAIAAVVAAVVLSIKQAHDQYYRFDIALDKAKEGLTRANEQLDVAKDRLGEVSESLEKIKNVDDTFDGLNRGTAEWNKALVEANENVLGLIEKYPELAKYTERGKYGELTLTDRGQEIAQQNAQAQLESAQVNANRAQNEVFAAERDKYRMDFIHENAGFIEAKNTQYVSSGYGSTAITDDTAMNAEMDKILATWDAVDGDVKAFGNLLRNQGYTDEQITALTSNTDKLTELSTALSENTLAQQVSNESRASQLMSDNERYQNMNATMQHMVDVQVAQMMNDEEKRSEYGSEFDKQYTNKDEASRWAEQQGIFGEGSKYQNGKWYDAEGQEIERLNALSSDELYQEIRESYIADAIADNIQANGDSITAAIQKSLTAATLSGGEEFAGIFAGKDENGKGQFDTAGVQEFLQNGGINSIDLSSMTTGDWQELGFENAQDFMTAFNEYCKENPVKPEIEMPTDTTGDFSDEELSGVLEDVGMSQGAFDRMSEDMYENDDDYFQKRKQYLEDEIELRQKAIAAGGSDEFNEETESIEELTDELQGLKKQASDTAAMNMRMNKGVMNLVNNFDDLKYQLENCTEGSADYYQAMGELDEIVSDVVNIDTGTLSNGFYESAEAMQAMEDLANGDASAIDRLRVLASQDIVQHMEIQKVGDENISDIRNDLLTYQAELQAQLDADPLNTTVNLDDSQYVQKLNEMVQMGQITAEQAGAALSSMGIEYEIGTATGDYKVPVTTYETVVDESDDKTGFPKKWHTTEHTTYETEHGEYPVLKGTHYSGPGVQNAQTSSLGGNQIGSSKAPSGGGGGKGGGGKGGGGSKDKKSKYEPEKQDRKLDRYEKVNTAIDKIDSSIENLSMDQDRLFGTRWIDNLEKETGLLKDQIPWYEKKLDIQKQEAAELREQLGKEFGATFTDSGQLKNYKKIYNKLTKEYETARKKYAGKELSDEEKKKADDELKAIEKRQKTFDEIYKRYDDLYSKDIPGTEKALKEIQDRLEDIAEETRKARREAAETLHELRDTARDTEKTYKNLFGEHPEINIDIAMRGIDDIMNGTELNEKAQQWITDYTNKAKSATGEMKAWYEKQAQGIQQALNNGGLSLFSLNDQNTDDVLRMWEEWSKTGKYTIEGQVSENEAALQEMLKDAVEKGNQMMSNLSNYISDLLDGMEALAEIMDSEIENQLNGLDAINDKIEYQQDMMEMIYGDQTSATQIQLLNRQAQVEESRLPILQKQLSIQQEVTQAAKERYEIDRKNNDGKINQDLLDEYLDAVQKERDIDQEILDTRKAITEAYRDAKEAANDLAVDNWLKNFDGQINGVNVPLEYMADQWERIQENEELYLDDLNKAYEIQKLSNKYQQMLNDTVDPTIQQKITDQMREQLAYLNEKTNLSKYDVDYANAQLEILQKTIALEDARAAKNQMKLRRDSQGNYQYVYAADQNKTAEAENDLLDANMNAYNMSKEQQASVQDSYIQKVQDMADALRKAANDATLDEEQIAAITQDIIDKGHEYLEAMGEQLNTSQKNMINSFIDTAEQMQDEYAEKVHSIAEELKEDTSRGLDDVDDRFNTSVKNWADGEADIRNESLKTKKNILDNIRAFTAAIGEANVSIAEPLGEMQSGMDDIDSSIVKTKTDMEDLFKLLRDQSGEFSATADQVKVLQDSLTNSNNELSKYYEKLKAAEDKIESQQAVILGYQQQSEGKNGKSGSGSSGSGGSGSGGDSGKGKSDWKGANWSDIVKVYNLINTGKLGVGVAHRVDLAKSMGYSVAAGYGGQKLINLTYSRSNGGAGMSWEDAKKQMGYDTGGYTGEWGKEGRLAFLHQKELVLNAEDTKNVLAAVEAVRVITDQLRSSAFTGSISTAIGKAAQNNIQGNNVEQRVEITANFPNVSSADEIEKALLNISDRSYQYAYNKNDIPW